MKAATHRPLVYAAEDVISIHAAREGGDHVNKAPLVNAAISIHAAREGGDELDATNLRAFLISIHAAREGGDKSKSPNRIMFTNFNPRRP